MLEDLHWADRGTLDYLMHLSRNLQGPRLLIVGTYRDVDLDRSHPLSGALADLRRAGNFGRVLLRGLTPDEVGRMLNRLAGQDLRWSLAATVHKRTEGNPLFIQEMLRHLVEEGLLDDPDAMEMRIPEGLRDVIGKRLSALSPECNRLLSMAAVIGREFRLDVLQTLAEQPEEAVIASIKEAVKVGVLEDRSQTGQVRFWFSHAYFQQTLYEELFTPRRLRLHQQVARTLERLYGNRLSEHAAELAQHFAQSSDPLDLRKAVHYGEVAAGRAVSVYAYGEAVRHLETALQAQEVLDLDDKLKRCDLLLALGEALMPAGEALRASEDVAERAYALAEALSDTERASHSCWLAIYGLMLNGAGSAYGTQTFHNWVERAEAHAAIGTAARVFADLALARDHVAMDRWAEYQDLNWLALSLARQLADPEVLGTAAAMVLNGVGIRRSAPQYWTRELALALEMATLPSAGISYRTFALLRKNVATICLSGGERALAEQQWRELTDLSAKTHDAELLLISARVEPIRQLIDGDIEAAVRATEAMRVLAADIGSPDYGRRMATYEGFRPLLHRGQAQEALDAWARRGIIRAGSELTRRGRPVLPTWAETARSGKYWTATARWVMCFPRTTTPLPGS
ncbi:MAG: hypothetical protein EXR51_09195 [Dehalococcoidia bacterium]|nr:hypothetical protein [Dehalococcoidia bacterium]